MIPNIHNYNDPKVNQDDTPDIVVQDDIIEDIVISDVESDPSC